MTWKKFQDNAYRLTEKEVAKLTPFIMSQYKEALKQIKTPSVMLGHGVGHDPLRIQSGTFVTCLWPTTV